ncbi:MAG TPA: hypothetical protein VLV87_09075 [Gammaproteobacteria bacterium]|nr:hypothetical protein [Gammaproteobacteria bacterium]
MSGAHFLIIGLRHFCRTALLTALIALAACASSPPLPAPPATEPTFNDYVIVPGVRIGSVSIGMTGKQLLDVMGSPQSALNYSDGAAYHYPGNFGVVLVNATQQVVRVTASESSYQTQEGLKTGQTDLEMRTILGNPDETINVGNDQSPYYRNCYDKKGIAVYVDWNGKIASISVFNPGDTCL